MQSAISVNNLTKSYGTKPVLRGLTFEVPQGRITAIAGPNGAGKTTCLRIMTTTLMPTGGSVRVYNRDVVTHAAFVRREVAVVPQDCLPDRDLTGWELVYGYLLTRGFPRRAAREQADEVLRQLSLWDVRNRITATYSGGMKQRTVVAMALATKARILFLDEPTTSLDPVAKREVWAILRRLIGQSTLVLTSHMMDEVEALADQVIVIDRGHCLAVGTVEELRRLAPSNEKVLVSNVIPLQELAPYGRVYEDGGRWAVFPQDDAAIYGLLELGRSRGVGVSVLPAGFEDAYLAILQRTVTAE